MLFFLAIVSIILFVDLTASYLPKAFLPLVYIDNSPVGVAENTPPVEATGTTDSQRLASEAEDRIFNGG